MTMIVSNTMSTTTRAGSWLFTAVPANAAIEPVTPKTAAMRQCICQESIRLHRLTLRLDTCILGHMTTATQRALAKFAEGQSKLWAELNAAFASASTSTPMPTTSPVAPTMTQTTAWYAKHGSVLKQIDAKGGTVPFEEFFKYATGAGYSGASYSQMYRKDGLLIRDHSKKSISLTSKGEKRLAYADKYLKTRGFDL